MNVLGLDTATSSSAAALLLADGQTGEARDDPNPGAHPGHATRLLELARVLLDRAGLGWEDLERIAVGVGPGTFTGLRVGIATARGLAQSLGVELVGVSSLQALARSALERQDADTGLADPRAPVVLSVIDARRGEVFAAAYETGEDAAPRVLRAAAALAPERLADLVRQLRGDAVAQRRQWLAVGDGAVRYRAHLEAAGVRVPDDGSALHSVSAAAICLLGRVAALPGDRGVAPDYRRRPDAELALEGAGTQEGPA